MRAADRVCRARGAEIHAADYASLQDALDALPGEGGIVLLPPGTFEINEPLRVRRGDVLIRGAGGSTHIINQNKQGQPALVLEHADGKKVKKQDRLWRVMLSEFRITGNPQSGPGIVANYIEEIFLQGLTVSHHGSDGILLDHCYEDPRISACLITYNAGVGLNLLGCHDIVVSANQFEENQDALHCFDGFNLCMTGNCVDDHLQHGVVIENTYGSVVSGNMIEECKGAALIMDRDCYGNTVSANVIAHNGQGVVLKDAHGCAVSANTFTIMGEHAVLLEKGSGRITVTGNNFSDSYLGEGRRPPQERRPGRRGDDDRRRPARRADREPVLQRPAQGDRSSIRRRRRVCRQRAGRCRQRLARRTSRLGGGGQRERRRVRCRPFVFTRRAVQKCCGGRTWKSARPPRARCASATPP